nr:hypothetical protein [Tanacetum cinerariifolium]
MLDQYNALITNEIRVLVPRTTNVNIVRPMWLFRHKFNVDGSLRRYKARLVANGRSQQLSINCDETFSLVSSLSGLKQAPRAWFQCFASYATRVGFQHSKIDSSLFIFHRGTHIAYLIFYVDDISLPHEEFAMTDLGSLNHNICVSAQCSTACLFLSHATYAEELFDWAHMQNCNPCRTPIDTNSKLGPDSDPVSYLTFYHSLADALQYLTFTHSHLSYLHVSNTDQLNTYMDPAGVGLSLVVPPLAIVFFLLSWSAKRQATLSTSSIQDEYRGVANVVTESTWLRNLLCELHAPIFSATLVYCENVSVVYLSSNLVQYQRIKHIELDIHFVHDFVAKGLMRSCMFSLAMSMTIYLPRVFLVHCFKIFTLI